MAVLLNLFFSSRYSQKTQNEEFLAEVLLIDRAISYKKVS